MTCNPPWPLNSTYAPLSVCGRFMFLIILSLVSGISCLECAVSHYGSLLPSCVSLMHHQQGILKLKARELQGLEGDGDSAVAAAKGLCPDSKLF